MAPLHLNSGSQRSTARQAVQLAVLAVILAQSAIIWWLASERSRLQAAASTFPTQGTVEDVPAARARPPLEVPPLPTGLLSTPPVARGKAIVVPPLPSLGGATSLPLTQPLPAPVAAQPAPAPLPSAPSSRTGSAVVDEMLDTAIQVRELGATETALETLKKADQMLPGNPTIQRELAFTLQKMGRTPVAQATPPPPLLTETLEPLAPEPPQAKGPVRIASCDMKRDMTSSDTQRMNFSVLLSAQPDAQIQPQFLQVDVFFYEKTADGQVELRRGDAALSSFDERVDFSSGTEVLNVNFSPPTEEELATHGPRSFYGYIVKLYYQQQLVDTAASPTSLINRPA